MKRKTRQFLAHSLKLRAILDAADRRIAEGAGIGHAEFWQKVASTQRARDGKRNGTKRR